MGIFDFVGEIVSLPLDIVSDTSSAIQGKKIEKTKERLKEIGKDLEDFIDGN